MPKRIRVPNIDWVVYQGDRGFEGRVCVDGKEVYVTHAETQERAASLARRAARRRHYKHIIEWARSHGAKV